MSILTQVIILSYLMNKNRVLKKVYLPVICLVLLLGITMPHLWAFQSIAEDVDTETEARGVQSHGVIHNIAKDRRVERIGGLYQPEGLDIYLKRHLDVIQTQMKQMENEMQQMREDLKVIRLALENSSSSPELSQKTTTAS